MAQIWHIAEVQAFMRTIKHSPTSAKDIATDVQVILFSNDLILSKKDI